MHECLKHRALRRATLVRGQTARARAPAPAITRENSQIGTTAHLRALFFNTLLGARAAGA